MERLQSMPPELSSSQIVHMAFVILAFSSTGMICDLNKHNWGVRRQGRHRSSQTGWALGWPPQLQGQKGAQRCLSFRQKCWPLAPVGPGSSLRRRALIVPPAIRWKGPRKALSAGCLDQSPSLWTHFFGGGQSPSAFRRLLLFRRTAADHVTITGLPLRLCLCLLPSWRRLCWERTSQKTTQQTL